MDTTQAARNLAFELKQRECYARTVGHDMVVFFDPATSKQQSCSYDLPTLLNAFELGLVERRNIMTTVADGHNEAIENLLFSPLYRLAFPCKRGIQSAKSGWAEFQGNPHEGDDHEQSEQDYFGYPASRPFFPAS